MERTFNLETFAQGALAEQLNTEMQKVFDNIADPNTEATKTRKVTLTMTFKPNSKREMTNTSIEAKSALAPVKAFETSILIEKDIQTGKVMAAELKSQIPGQEELEIEDSAIAQAEDGKILDLRKQAK